MGIVMSQSSMPLISWIADILGILMNGIYFVLEKIGIPNIGVAIILFTLIIYALMTPLQIKQQKFSKLSSVMQPELQKIQKKYKNKKDQASMQKMQEETSAVYQKYGVSPTGSCVQLLIQMPVLFALYQVIYHIPGYISNVRDIFSGLVTKITSISGYSDIIHQFMTDNKVMVTGISSTGELTNNQVIDFLYALSPAQWDKLETVGKFSAFSGEIEKTSEKIAHVSGFLGMNISDNPWSIIQNSLAAGSYLLVFAAIMIPVLAWFTQWLNYKLMPQATTGNEEPNAMANSMKTMNTVMPIMSAFFCMTFAVGIGIYWIAGAVIRSVQQLIINKKMDALGIEELIQENQEKINKKRAKAGLPPQKITQQARQSVRNIEEPQGPTQEEKAEAIKKSTEYYQSTANAKPGSLAAKANMVKQFDEKSKRR